MLVWISVTAGFAWTAYFSVPILFVSTMHLLAQGTLPDINLKDFANIGGFAIFAYAMYRLHVATVANHRTDMAEERAIRSKHAEAIAHNTTATLRLTDRIDRLTGERKES